MTFYFSRLVCGCDVIGRMASHNNFYLYTACRGILQRFLYLSSCTTIYNYIGLRAMVSTVNAANSQWRRRLSACVRVRGSYIPSKCLTARFAPQIWRATCRYSLPYKFTCLLNNY